MARFVNQDNTGYRPGGQYAKTIAAITRDGVCPFCHEHLAAYHKNPILIEGKHWVVTKNMYPYEGAKHHLLLIHKRHIEHVSDMSNEGWSELKRLVEQSCQLFEMAGAALLMRFGETKYNGASVSHLHAMLVQGPGDPESKSVLTRVG